MNELVTYNELEKMANAIAKSKLFNITTPEQALALMVVAASEGRAPGSVAKDYHIIQNRPALRADAMLARFQKAGGKVTWSSYTDQVVEATFSHPQGGTITLAWTFEQAKRIGLTNKDNWRMYPRAMLRSRVIAEGVRTCFPAVIVGEYSVEEVQDFDVSPLKEEVSNPVAVFDTKPAAIEYTAEPEGDFALYVPDTDGTPKIYKQCHSMEDWHKEYAAMDNRIWGSKKLKDEAKQNMADAFYKMNEVFVNKYLMETTENEAV